MPYAINKLDRTRIYFEDDGGEGDAVVLYGGILDSVDLVRGSDIAQSLQTLTEEFRLIFADHRGLGKSDKPHDVKAYDIQLRVADTVAILDDLSLGRAHFIGTSYGGRLCFGIGEHAPERVLSMVAGGQQPYAMNPDGPLARVVQEAMKASQIEGIEAFVEALEQFSGVRIPKAKRVVYLENDAIAVKAASDVMLSEGTIVSNLKIWPFPCLIFVGANDIDFYGQAKKASEEIPNAEFLELGGADHMGAHLIHDTVIPAVLRTLRSVSN